MRVIDLGIQKLCLLDSISDIDVEHSGLVIVSGSHGGLSSGRYALKYSPQLVIFNDAGIGKDNAGIAALKQLESFNIAAAALSAHSCRIGDAEDGWQNGEISFVNEPAKTMGIKQIKLKEQLEFLFTS